MYLSVHEGKKPIKCGICDYSCAVKSTMHQFMKEKRTFGEPDPNEEFGLRLRVSIDPVVPRVPTLRKRTLY